MGDSLIHVFVLSPKDVLEFAAHFEEKSVYFYDNLSKMIKDPKIKEIFSLFANEEAKHILTFKKMIENSNKEEYEKKSIPEHIEYLQNYINSSVFSKEIIAEKLKRVKDVESTFEFAMGMELDQVLFYNEIKESLKEKDRGLIDDIMNEERLHFTRIMQLKQMKGY